MIQILFGALLIFSFGFSWGFWIFSIIPRLRPREPHPALMAVTGMAGWAIVLLWLSLFLPVSHPAVQLIGWLPVAATFTRAAARKAILIAPPLTRHYRWWLSLTVLFTLLCSSWFIEHEDTLQYHLDIIAWARNHRVVPGIVHTNLRTGLQSSWFLLQAFFQFPWQSTAALSPLNPLFLLLFSWFTASQLSQTTAAGRLVWQPAAWHIALLTGSLTFTLFYLSAASTSPDPAVCFYTWAAFFLLLTNDTRLLAFLFVFFAFTLKFNAVPALLLLPFFARRNDLAPTIVFTAIAVLPLLIRNYISSGYPFFPSAMLHLFSPDWQLSTAAQAQLQQYVFDYAVSNLSTFELSAQYLPVTLLSLSALVYLAVVKRKMVQQPLQPADKILLVAGAGMLFCAVTAPSIRFAQPFAFILIVFAIDHLLSRFPAIARKIAFISLYALLFFLAAYDGYRLIRYSSAGMIWTPKGTITNDAHPVISGQAVRRTINIEDGFREKTTP